MFYKLLITHYIPKWLAERRLRQKIAVEFLALNGSSPVVDYFGPVLQAIVLFLLARVFGFSQVEESFGFVDAAVDSSVEYELDENVDDSVLIYAKITGKRSNPNSLVGLDHVLYCALAKVVVNDIDVPFHEPIWPQVFHLIGEPFWVAVPVCVAQLVHSIDGQVVFVRESFLLFEWILRPVGPEHVSHD